MRQRRLAAPRAAGDQIEGELGNPAAQHLVEARHAGGQLANRNAVAHFLVSVGAMSSIVGHALRSTWIVNRSPMKVVMSAKKVPNRAAAAAVGDGGIVRPSRRAASPSLRVRRRRRGKRTPLRQLCAAHEQRSGRRRRPRGERDARGACRRPGRPPSRRRPHRRRRAGARATVAPARAAPG